MKQTTRKGLDWLDDAPLLLSASRRIDATPDAVWARVADHSTWPDWWAGLKHVEPGAQPTGVGGTRTVKLAGGLTIQEEFLAWEEDRRFAFVVTHMKPKIIRTLVEDLTLEPVDGGATKVTYTQGWDPIGGKPVQAILRKTTQPQIEKALEELARLVGG